MKNLKKIFLAIVAAGMIYSCEDAYNIVQEGEYQEDIAILTVDDMRSALIEAYDVVSVEDVISFTSVFTDETAIGVENGGQNLADYRFQLFPTNDFASAIWIQNYAMIDRVNRIIEAADDIEVDPADADLLAEKNRILGEARLIRAFAHFQLLTFFSTDLKDDSKLGVIIMDHVAPLLPNVEQLPRSTNGEVFAFIQEDMDFAEANMTVGNSPAFVTPRFRVALQARMALYRGQWQQAIDFADQARSMGPDLTPRAQYPDMFRPVGGTQAVGENIFVLERPANKRGIVSEWFFNGASAGGAFMEVSRSLFNELSEGNDIRLQVNVNLAESIIAPDYATVFNYREADVLVIGKYPGNPARNLPLNNNVSVFRVSELYLIKAEAQVHLGQRFAARTTLNQLRAQRLSGQTSLPITQFGDDQSAFRAVLDERRKELAFEGHRYIDLKRLGTLAGVNSVERYVRDCTPYGACELPVTDYRFTLPIPLDELNGNNVIQSQQNPGY